VLPIRITGDSVLHTPSAAVTGFDQELRSLANDMVDTMLAAPGVGLAAPQVGVPLRMFVYRWVDDDLLTWQGVAVNPTLWQSPIPVSEPDEDEDSEGCLSLPGERFPLRRASSVRLSAVDLQGQPFEVNADGWLARIFQHEYDHLDGILYVDRLGAAHAKAAAKAIKRRNWAEPGLSWVPGEDHLED